MTFNCRRNDGSLVFWNQQWMAYKNGFSNTLQRNHWLGLDKIHALSTKDAQRDVENGSVGQQMHKWCHLHFSASVSQWLLVRRAWILCEE